ncbi:MAG TPA: alkaline phosphatase [Bryobacteraceae bacterium]|nr:alkaline phosphatase [Bryobacteraceae bacterium]
MTAVKRIALLALCAVTATSAAFAAERRAKNVILFLGDAGGIATLNAASLHAHDAPQKLFIQQMPNFALSDTSAADSWVTDSAAGMTAIVTGQKTNNGVISQSASAVKGKVDGDTLKTILEYAEERGLSTGVITNTSIADATPAACYAHSNDRKKAAEIFSQIISPRFGDGVDVVVGRGRKAVFAATAEAGLDVDQGLKKAGYALYEDPSGIPADGRKVMSVVDGSFEVAPTVKRAVEILSKNPKGFFLMVEWDMHTNNLQRGLDNVVAMDQAIRQTAEQVKNDTLIVFLADHSFDLRVRGGKKGQSMLPLPGDDEKKPRIRVDDGHTGEEVLVAAKGPGSERVRGFIPNTEVFRIMMAAYGWRETPAKK